MGSWIRIRNANADPDPEGGNSAPKRRKIKSEAQKFFKKLVFFVIRA
jgi:hypothetical protein